MANTFPGSKVLNSLTGTELVEVATSGSLACLATTQTIANLAAGSSGVTIGTTTITSGTTTRVLYDNAGVVGEYTISGSGNVAMTTSPTFSTSLTVSSGALITSGNLSSAAWTTSGIRQQFGAASYTDTSSSGTVAAAYTDLHGASTILASSATTYTQYYGAFFKAPVASTNVTMTNKSALGADTVSIGGAAQSTYALAVTGNTQLGTTGSHTTIFGNATGVPFAAFDANTAGTPSVLFRASASVQGMWMTGGGFGMGSAVNAPDTYMTRSSAGKFAIGAAGTTGDTTGRLGLAWLNWSGQSKVATQFDKTSDTTLANVTGLSAAVTAAKAYSFTAQLYTASNVAGGVKVAIGGTATATAITYDTLITDAGATTQPARAAALGTAGGVTAVTAALVTINGTITVNGGGTLTVQFAQNASNGTASSVLVGSTFIVQEF